MNWSSKFVFHVKYLTFQSNHLGSDLNISEKSLPVTNVEILECFISPIHRQYPPLAHRPLQSMSWIKLPFGKRATFWVMMRVDYTEGLQPHRTENTQMWCVSMCACMWDGWRARVFWSWMRSHPCPRGKRPRLWGLQASGLQWDAHANSHMGRNPPSTMFLNYSIVLSHSSQLMLVRHHLLFPQKAL